MASRAGHRSPPQAGVWAPALGRPAPHKPARRRLSPGHCRIGWEVPSPAWPAPRFDLHRPVKLQRLGSLGDIQPAAAAQRTVCHPMANRSQGLSHGAGRIGRPATSAAQRLPTRTTWHGPPAHQPVATTCKRLGSTELPALPDCAMHGSIHPAPHAEAGVHTSCPGSRHALPGMPARPSP